jgi:hypothetical protein
MTSVVECFSILCQATFPYGQCMDWTTQTSQCGGDDGNEDMCASQKTCSGLALQNVSCFYLDYPKIQDGALLFSLSFRFLFSLKVVEATLRAGGATMALELELVHVW